MWKYYTLVKQLGCIDQERGLGVKWLTTKSKEYLPKQTMSDKLVHLLVNDEVRLPANPLEVPKCSEFLKLVRSRSIDTFEKAMVSNEISQRKIQLI